jgi:hypothetical protein
MCRTFTLIRGKTQPFFQPTNDLPSVSLVLSEQEDYSDACHGPAMKIPDNPFEFGLGESVCGEAESEKRKDREVQFQVLFLLVSLIIGGALPSMTSRLQGLDDSLTETLNRQKLNCQ